MRIDATMTSRIHVSAVYKTSYMNFWGADELFVCVCTNKQTNIQTNIQTYKQPEIHAHTHERHAGARDTCKIGDVDSWLLLPDYFY